MKESRPLSLRVLAVPLLLLTFPLIATAQRYKVTDLGTLGGNWSVGGGVNALGQVVGTLATPSDSQGHPFVFMSGNRVDIGTLGGALSKGLAINSSGEVTGYSQNSTGATRGFLYANGHLTDIGDLGGGTSDAYAINDAGQIVGASYTANDEVHPFLFSGGRMIDLGTLGSHQPDWWNTALGINNLGQVVGYSYQANGNFRGFVYSNGTMKALGTLGGAYSQAYAINDAGQITGNAYTKLASHAFLLSGGKMIDCGTLMGSLGTSWGFAINNSGVVVGESTIPDNSTYHAFIFTGGKIQDLNALIPAGSGWMLGGANGVNDAGQIVGWGIVHGQEHGFLLTPQ